MARKTKAERLADIHAEAVAEFDTVQSALRDERLQCLKDRRFYSISGAQWEGPLEDQFENKPKFEVNKIHLSVMRIINEYRNNRISVDFKAKHGNVDDKFADTCDGMYRADENDSVADEAYDNAFEEAVAGGFGAWRLRAEYEDDEDPDDDRQRICIEPIFDADSSVFYDLQAKRQDKSDAKKCWVLTSMTLDAYKNEYGDDPASWPKTIHQLEFDWATPDVVFIAEYYVVEEAQETIHIWELLDGTEKRLTDDEHEEQLEKLEAIGAEEVRTKKVKRRKVHKYIMSGSKILDDCGYIAGSCIPIIPVYGKRWFVDNVERCMGHVRLAKDAQRLKNMQLSKLGEISALSTVEKPILTPEQIAGHQQMWQDDNIKNYPYLLINPITDPNGQEAVSGPVAYTRAPQIPPAMAALLQITEDDINDLLGNQQDGEQLQGNISTETAHLVQNRLDMQTFIYMSNFAKAMKRCGEVWLSMGKDVYVEEDREMDTLSEDGESSTITLMKPVMDPDTGEVVHLNDFSKAKMKVVTDVGPSSSTRRMATVRALTNMLGAATDPETQQVLGAMIMMNMEGEGVEDVRGYFRDRLIKMGVVKPTEDEQRELAEEQANAKPTPQDQYFEAAAMREQSEAVKNQVEVISEQAKADKLRAETQEILSQLDLEKLRAMVDVIEKLGPRVAPPTAPGSTVEGM
jgi:hypothetical protein